MLDWGRTATYFSTSLPWRPSTLKTATYLYLLVANAWPAKAAAKMKDLRYILLLRGEIG
jgi:hypothetical protein